MNADEKAVAECYGPIVKCSLGKSGDNRLICSCSGCHSHWMAMTLAARIRADASGEVAAALARAERAEALVRKVARSGVELDDERIDYLTVQIDWATWGDIARIAELEKP